MNSVINAIVGILLLVGVGTVGTAAFHNSVKKETVTKVFQKLHRHGELESFTRKLTGTKRPN